MKKFIIGFTLGIIFSNIIGFIRAQRKIEQEENEIYIDERGEE